MQLMFFQLNTTAPPNSVHWRTFQMSLKRTQCPENSLVDANQIGTQKEKRREDGSSRRFI
jgi:hypothetical protein